MPGPRRRAGTRSRTVRSACRSTTVEVTPAGLCKARWTAGTTSAAATSTGRPSTAISVTAGSAFSPSVATLGEKADPAVTEIAVDGRPVDVAAALVVPAVHLALHKPAGVTSTVVDRHADRTVLDLVPARLLGPGIRLYPVGRLDLDSEGLLILTNDGAWTDRVLHPRHGVEREYAVDPVAWVQHPVRPRPVVRQ